MRLSRLRPGGDGVIFERGGGVSEMWAEVEAEIRG